MKKKLTLLTLLLFLKIVANGQSLTKQERTFNIQFLDESTGIKVIPDYVELRNRESAKFYKVYSKQIQRNGTLSLNVPKGTYDITVNSRAYQPMSSHFDIIDKPLSIRFNLVPLTPLKEISSAYIESLHRPDAMVIVGFIVDDVSGNPLNNIMVYSADYATKTVSNKNGFFQLILPIAKVESEIEKRGTIFFKKSNYKTEIRKNFDMWPNGDMILQVKMKKGKGFNEQKVILNRDANRLPLNSSEPVKEK